jgi:IS5 family transposase
MQDRRDQLGFLGAFAPKNFGRNDRLDRMGDLAKWYRFEKLLKKLSPEGGPGRPPYEPLVMFKALLLAYLYDLSDAELEQQLNDRVSFRRFVGLPLDAAMPDHTTLCRFRNRLVEAGLLEKLFAEFNHQLETKGLILKRGTLIDATLIESASARPRKDEDDDEGGHGGDPDARFVKREGKAGSVYGYKAHVATDQDSQLIRKAEMTAANVNDTVVADQLICFDESAVYADKAYSTKARRALLKAAGIKDGIMHKSWGGGPALTPWQRRRNKQIVPIRSQVETTFAVFKKHMGYRRSRYIGLVKNKAHLLFVAFTYNLRRASVLAYT